MTEPLGLVKPVSAVRIEGRNTLSNKSDLQPQNANKKEEYYGVRDNNMQKMILKKTNKKNNPLHLQMKVRYRVLISFSFMFSSGNGLSSLRQVFN